MPYEFEHFSMEFSKDGGLDELIALDRYAASTHDPSKMNVGDTIVFIADEIKGTRLVGMITGKNNGVFSVTDRTGNAHEVREELVTKPLETKPQEMWARWAYGASLVEKEEIRKDIENEFRWLLDGFRYSPGGRVQLGLGHEYLGLEKAPLTLTNCFVLKPPAGSDDPVEQWNNVIDIVLTEMQISRRGGGCGINISEIHEVSGVRNPNVTLFLPEDHRDFGELQNMVKLDKFNSVKITSDHNVFSDRTIVVGDSIEGHIEATRQMVISLYDGKSVLMDFSQIRHRNAIVKGVNGRSSGAAAWMELFAVVVGLIAQVTIDPVDFAEIYSFVINLIQQGGSRRGALMLVMDVNNKFIKKFITRKQTLGYLQGANISVGITDEFMDTLKSAKRLTESKMATPRLEHHKALQVWDLIIESAWSSAEPGVIWMSRYNKESNSWYFAEVVATNPCGEQGLPPNGACNLGHLVLPAFVKGDWTKGRAEVDWEELARASRLGVRFQDNMVDYGYFPTPETEAQQKLERRVGMGTMGLGTMLIMLGLRYGSKETEEFIDDLYSFIAANAYDSSMDLAREKGPFPAYVYEKHIQSGFMKRLLESYPWLANKLKSHGIRNVTILTQAPTGSTGTYIDGIPGNNCSTGIEPYFAFTYWRAGRLGVYEQEVELVKQYREANGLSKDDPLPDFFVTAQDLSPEDHVRVQGVIQRWVDSSISKTANAPNHYTKEDTDKLYMMAYDEGCKGMTIYRDGSRQFQVLSTEKDGAKIEAHGEAEKLKALTEANDDTNVVDEVREVFSIKKRPDELFGITKKVKVVMNNGNELVNAYVTVNVDPDTGLPCEVFIISNNADLNSLGNALGRMTTQFLRYGITEDNIEQAIKHLRTGQSFGSLSWWVANVIEGITYGKIKFPGNDKPARSGLNKCSNCGEMAYDKVNCICHACGDSKCN